MPKSRKRRTTKQKTSRPRSLLERGNEPMPGPHRKHPGYNQLCPVDDLIEEFGEEGADWLLDEYEAPLTVADFQLERCIRRDEFVLDDPLAGPTTMTAEKISEWLDLTFRVAAQMAKNAVVKGAVLPPELAQAIAERDQEEPVNHADVGADTVRGMYLEGLFFLNDRGMWDLAES